MARKRVADSRVEAGELPAELAVCWVEDWAGAYEVEREPWQSEDDILFGQMHLAWQRWCRARRAWFEERGINSREEREGYGVRLTPRWRAHPRAVEAGWGRGDGAP